MIRKVKTAQELLNLQKTGVKIVMLDIRAHAKYQSYHFPHAIWIQKEVLLATPEQFLDPNQQAYLTCNAGNSSQVIAHLLQQKGFKIDYVAGGMNPLVAAFFKKANRV